MTDSALDEIRRSQSIIDQFREAAGGGFLAKTFNQLTGFQSSVSDNLFTSLSHTPALTSTFENFIDQQYRITSQIDKYLEVTKIPLASLPEPPKIDTRGFAALNDIASSLAGESLNLAGSMDSISSALSQIRENTLVFESANAAARLFEQQIGTHRVIEELRKSSLPEILRNANAISKSIVDEQLLEEHSPSDTLEKDIERKGFWDTIATLPTNVRAIVLYLMLQLLIGIVAQYISTTILPSSDPATINHLIQIFPSEYREVWLDNYRRVKVDSLRVREFPDKDSRVIFGLVGGQIVEIIERDSGWSLVYFWDADNETHVQGWAATSYLGKIE